ncbi:PREPROTEIN TRANSLOCASE SUBUNIT SECE1 [Salix koriyanagi]|uniref:PREPROTEIN TRANSLOCASE SUBUNIT SECE1 n=1 Tax=Salix koriyanagi TaxID=2511006 RepID=A0A9Q0X2D4_9ROSI|nr:PREPROTEIN TRANSLOCASE SUBUNIT SECE1 [Salix koriyanagi]
MAGWNPPELQSFDFEDEAESLQYEYPPAPSYPYPPPSPQQSPYSTQQPVSTPLTPWKGHSLLSIKLPLTQPPSKPTLSSPTLQFQPPPLSVSISQSHPKILTITHSKTKERRGCSVIKAVEKESTESEAVERPGTESESESELSVTGELGAEIKKAMMERKSKEEGNLWSGVVEEIQEIEWPACFW